MWAAIVSRRRIDLTQNMFRLSMILCALPSRQRCAACHVAGDVGRFEKTCGANDETCANHREASDLRYKDASVLLFSKQRASNTDTE